MAILAVFHNFFGYYQNAEKLPFLQNFLCNILLHMQHDLYIIYINLCSPYANKTPLFCPPEKNGNSRRGKRLRFDFNPARYNYPRSLVSTICIIIRL